MGCNKKERMKKHKSDWLGAARLPIARLGFAGIVAFLASCASVGENTQGVRQETARGVKGAVNAPVEDLNLRKIEIPEVLARIDPVYQPDKTFACDDISQELAELETVLEPDVDADPEDKSRTENFSEKAANKLSDVLVDTGRGLIPFRSLVRWASGASDAEKRVRNAYRNGLLRRAYLKGQAQALNCLS